MVQFYQSRDVGKSLGRGLREGLEPTLDYKINQSRVASALDLAKNEIANVDNPIDAYTTLAKHLLPLPGGSQVLSEAAPQLLRMQYAKKAVENTVGQGDQPQPPQQAAQAPNRPRIVAPNPNAQQAPTNARTLPDLAKTPLMPSPQGEKTPPTKADVQPMPPLSLDEEKQIISQYGDIAAGQAEVARINNQRKAQNEYIAIKNQNEAFQREQQFKNEEEIEKQITKSFPQAQGSDLETVKQLFKRYSDLPDFNEQASAVRKDWNKVQAARSAIKDSSRPGFFRRLLGDDGRRQIKNLEKSFDVYRNLGLEDQGRAALSEAGWGPAQVDYIANPPSKEVENLYKSIPEKSRLTDFTFKNPPLQLPFMSNQIAEWQKEEIKPYLQDILQMYPDQSLNIIRKAFTDKGYTWQAVGDAINDLVQQVELSDYNMALLPDMARPPVDALDNIWYGESWNLFNWMGGKQ